MIFKWSLLMACAYISTCQAAFVDTLNKCSIKDGDCLKNLIHTIVADISSNGIQEYDIPKIDPLELKDIKISVLNVLNFTLDAVTIYGFKDCVVKHVDFNTAVDKGEAVFDLTCNVLVEGKHKIEGSSALLQNAFGNEPIHTDGTFKLQLDDVQLKLTLIYDIIKKDGDTYLNCRREEFRYTFNVGGFNLDANNIFLGDTDSSKAIVEFANQNWKTVIDSFGRNFFDVALDILNDILQRLFENTATKYFFLEDLSSFVKK